MRPVTSIHPTARWPAALALLVLVAILAGCGSQAGMSRASERAEPADGDAAAELTDGDMAADGETADEETTGGGPASASGEAAPIEQRIIKTGEVSVQVADVAIAVGRVRAFAVDLGGYVGGSQAGASDEGATLTLRIPAARFDEALERLRDLDGEVVAEATRESDVTRQVIDLGARIANLESSEASYRVLLERAERIDDVLAVQSRLDGVRGEIEQLEAQLQEIEGDADLSTLTVSLIPVPAPIEAISTTWDPTAELDAALAALVGIGQGLLNAIIWFGIVWLPVLLLLAIGTLLALRAVLEVRRRLPMAPGAVPAGRDVPPA